MQTLATVPAATALVQQPPAPAAPALTYSVPDDAAEPVTRFFDASQIAALRRLADVLVPATATEPGATACRAPEFLDFLLSRSPSGRQTLYRNGVDTLNLQARLRHGKAFSDTTPAEADVILEPLRRPWSYEPSDPFEAFLRTAHRELRQAAANSRTRAVATGNVQQVRWLRPL
jgi:hypothetical protein